MGRAGIDIWEGISDNLGYVEGLYEKYESTLDNMGGWHRFFAHLGAEGSRGDMRIFGLIEAYRTYGHLMAQINPLAVEDPAEPWELSLQASGFTAADLGVDFQTGGLLPQERAPLAEILGVLKHIYCGQIGIEYMGLQHLELEQWLQERFEGGRFEVQLHIEQKKMVLQYLNRSELFESFLHKKYPGEKRFSLEGGETLIPMLAAILNKGAELGLRECVLGMAHRGRLNVIANILGRSYISIFKEFEEFIIPEEGSGDVKYHKGFNAAIKTLTGQDLQVELVHNPSHLEAVDPVVEGIVRAKQARLQEKERYVRVLPVLIHGDAALAGQGVIYETLQLSRLSGYTTGGTIHIVINNQIGFTTLPHDGRSTRYCTDIARTFGAPVFHINGEDPEACIYATNLAVELRQKFHCDVFLDLNCYRKYGHNEGDEPAYTQPLQYKLIRKKRPIREIYRDELIRCGVVEQHLAEELEEAFTRGLQEALETSKEQPAVAFTAAAAGNRSSQGISEKEGSLKTGVEVAVLRQLGERLCRWPSHFRIHHKLEQLHRNRLTMLGLDGEDSHPLDWGMAELLAYATLLCDGYDIRLSGQDVQRGTFSHRHAVLVDQDGERDPYCPLNYLTERQGHFEVINSPLSEYGVLAFEYGYSLAAPQQLVIWEAQFGDFANGAQVVLDQFIATAEQKWAERGPIVLFLPHGYEGQGPEHSSARIERILSLSSGGNWQVANPTLPEQLFHLLRAHVLKTLRRPLVVFTPKELLRHPQCVSPLAALADGYFETVLDDPMPPAQVRRLAFCSGHIYYDIAAFRTHQPAGSSDLALFRLEQLYPFDTSRVQSLLTHYSGFKTCYWVQEEPSNMGAWEFVRPLLQPLLPSDVPLQYVGRERSASTAAGTHALHQQQHRQILSALFPCT